MSKENKPLLSDEHLIATDDRVRRATLSNLDGLKMVRDHYEANITKDRELIQTLLLVGSKMADACERITIAAESGELKNTLVLDELIRPRYEWDHALTLAGEQGHKPTEK